MSENQVAGTKSIHLTWPDALQHSKHRIIFGQDAANRLGCEDAQRLQFTKKEQSEHVVDISIEQNSSPIGDCRRPARG